MILRSWLNYSKKLQVILKKEVQNNDRGTDNVDKHRQNTRDTTHRATWKDFKLCLQQTGKRQDQGHY